MKKIFLGIVSSIIFLLLAVPVFAANPKAPADYNGLNKGKSDTFHLYLYEKDIDWNIVEDGAWGKMTFKYEDKYTFNGHQLNPLSEYTLVNYESWNSISCIGNGISDEYGDVHITGMMPAKEDLLIDESEPGCPFKMTLRLGSFSSTFSFTSLTVVTGRD